MKKEKRDLLLFGLLGEENCLDVGQNTTLSDGDSREKLVQLFIVTDGKLQVTGDDTSLLVVTSSVTGELKNFSCQVFHDGSEVHWGTSSDTIGIVSFAEQTVNSAHGELKSCS